MRMKQLFYGTWILRNTNNPELNCQSATNYLIIKNDETIHFKTFVNYNYILGLKKSKKAQITCSQFDDTNETLSLRFSWISKHIYTYSILGIEIPEIKTNSIDYFSDNYMNISLHNNNILIVNDNNQNHNYNHTHKNKDIYYIFDLYKGNMKYPNIDITFNTFVFSQIFSILFSILISGHFTFSPYYFIIDYDNKIM